MISYIVQICLNLLDVNMLLQVAYTKILSVLLGFKTNPNVYFLLQSSAL